VAVSTAGKTAAATPTAWFGALRRFNAGYDVIGPFQPYVRLLCVLTVVYVRGCSSRVRLRVPRETTPAECRHFAYKIALGVAAAAAPSRGMIQCHQAAGLQPLAG
jgi:hypothetical protein